MIGTTMVNTIKNNKFCSKLKETVLGVTPGGYHLRQNLRSWKALSNDNSRSKNWFIGSKVTNVYNIISFKTWVPLMGSRVLPLRQCFRP